MQSGKDKPADHRKMAADCLEMAKRISFNQDGIRITEMAQ
jgi:hypothetical protein